MFVRPKMGKTIRWKLANKKIEATGVFPEEAEEPAYHAEKKKAEIWTCSSEQHAG